MSLQFGVWLRGQNFNLLAAGYVSLLGSVGRSTGGDIVHSMCVLGTLASGISVFCFMLVELAALVAWSWGLNLCSLCHVYLCLAAESAPSLPSQNSGSTSPDPFESQPLTMASSKPSSARKTPESFLGPNAALVNLDSLVTRPTPPAQSLNPFLAPGRNMSTLHLAACFAYPQTACVMAPELTASHFGVPVPIVLYLWPELHGLPMCGWKGAEPLGTQDYTAISL